MDLRALDRFITSSRRQAMVGMRLTCGLFGMRRWYRSSLSMQCEWACMCISEIACVLIFAGDGLGRWWIITSESPSSRSYGVSSFDVLVAPVTLIALCVGTKLTLHRDHILTISTGPPTANRPISGELGRPLVQAPCVRAHPITHRWISVSPLTPADKKGALDTYR